MRMTRFGRCVVNVSLHLLSRWIDVVSEKQLHALVRVDLKAGDGVVTTLAWNGRNQGRARRQSNNQVPWGRALVSGR
jgi:hypothetical protein